MTSLMPEGSWLQLVMLQGRGSSLLLFDRLDHQKVPCSFTVSSEAKDCYVTGVSSRCYRFFDEQVGFI